MKKLNNEITSKINRSMILTLIDQNPMISRAKLSQITGLDRSTVTHILNYLLNDKLVEEIEKGKSGSKGGRCPILLKINYNAKLFLLVEIGYEGIEVNLANLAGEIRKIWQYKITRGVPVSKLLDEIFSGIHDEIGEEFDKIIAAGVSCPGIIDARDGKVCFCALHNWKNEDIVVPLSGKYKFNILVENDANAAAVGEIQGLVAEGKKSMVYLIVRGAPPTSEQILGIGGAIVYNGELWHGTHFFAGEVSETVNALFKTPTIKKWREKALKKGKMDKSALEYLLKTADKDKNTALEVLDEVVQSFAKFLSEIVSFFDPECIMIYFKTRDDSELFWEKTKDSFFKQIPERLRPIVFHKPNLHNEAIKKGLLALVQDKVFIKSAVTSSILFK